MSPVPVARSSAQRTRCGCGQIDQAPLPSPILSVRQNLRNEIVPIGDRGKERPDVAALSVGRRDAFAAATSDG